jgi:hypothetical protein
MEELGRVYEEIKVLAKDLVDRVRSLIHEGNVRRIIIKDDQGVTYMEIPLSVATLGVIVAPVLAAVGAVATLLSNFTVVVERAQRGKGRPATASASAGSGFGATEDQVDMKDTLAQRVDNKGTKLEDLAGDGQHDSRGG